MIMDRSQPAWNSIMAQTNHYVDTKSNTSLHWPERSSRQRVLSQSSDFSAASGNDSSHSFLPNNVSYHQSDMSKNFYSAPNENRPSRTSLSPLHAPSSSQSQADSPGSFSSFEVSQRLREGRRLDHDDLLGPQPFSIRDNGPLSATSTSSRSDPESRFFQDSTSAQGSSPPSAHYSEQSNSRQSPIGTQAKSSSPNASSLAASPEYQKSEAPSSGSSSAEYTPSVHERQTNGLPIQQSNRNNSSASFPTQLSPLSPLVEPFNPSHASSQLHISPDYHSLPPSQNTSQDTSTIAPTLSSQQSTLDSVVQQQAMYRGVPAAVGSPSGSLTGMPSSQSISDSLAQTAAELGPPGSLTSAAFASLGAQLGLTGPTTLASLATRGQTEVPASNASASGAEEISTIFVVGFPDDMQEREFQNMFIFAPGFEAATLKGPGSGLGPISAASSLRDGQGPAMKAPFSPTMLNSPLGQFNAETFTSSNYPFSDQFDDGVQNTSLQQMLAHQHHQANMMSRESSTNTAIASARKQTIGFAKFRTRQQALDAREVLSGRRVDADKDCVLKAEMAKKNLHTKRGLANEAPAGAGSSVGVGNTTGNASLPPSVMALGQHNLAVAAAAALNPVVLASAIAQQTQTLQTRQQSPVSSTANNGQLGVAALLREQEHLQREARNGHQQHSAFDAFHSVPPSQISPVYHQNSRTAEGSAVAAADPRYNAYVAPSREGMSPGLADLSSSASISPGISAQSAYYRNSAQPVNRNPSQPSSSYDRFHPGAHEGDLNRRSVIGQTSDGYTTHSFYASSKGDDHYSTNGQNRQNGYYPSSASGMNGRFSGLSLNTSLASPMRPTSPPSAGLTSPRGANPADQNPPINTLYVGGLPAVLPSLTGPMSASHLEDSLRAVFSRSAGFKRLCFRQKSNGPMSFIEYENVEYATRALSDLYGHTLGGLVKGGIRLSYSKNPLGVRSNSVSQTNLSGYNSGPLSPPLSSAFGVDAFSLTPTSATHRRPPLDPFFQSSSGSLYSVNRSLTPRGPISPSATATPFSPFSVNSMDFGDSHYSQY